MLILLNYRIKGIYMHVKVYFNKMIYASACPAFSFFLKKKKTASPCKQHVHVSILYLTLNLHIFMTCVHFHNIVCVKNNGKYMF